MQQEDPVGGDLIAHGVPHALRADEPRLLHRRPMGNAPVGTRTHPRGTALVLLPAALDLALIELARRRRIGIAEGDLHLLARGLEPSRVARGDLLEILDVLALGRSVGEGVSGVGVGRVCHFRFPFGLVVVVLTMQMITNICLSHNRKMQPVNNFSTC